MGARGKWFGVNNFQQQAQVEEALRALPDEGIISFVGAEREGLLYLQNSNAGELPAHPFILRVVYGRPRSDP